MLAFVDQTVTAGQVTDAAFARVRAVMEPREIASLVLLVGHYMTVARFTAALQIELDAEPDGWAHEH